MTQKIQQIKSKLVLNLKRFYIHHQTDYCIRAYHISDYFVHLTSYVFKESKILNETSYF